jgi:hypothetical protein
MTVITNDAATGLTEHFSRAIGSLLPQHIDRLGWNAQQLAAHQREQLRALLATAVERSPFHARRLAGIDPGRFEPGQLAELPVMSKQQMMANFDELLTSRRVTRARAEQHLAASAREPGLLDGQYGCLAQAAAREYAGCSCRPPRSTPTCRRRSAEGLVPVGSPRPPPLLAQPPPLSPPGPGAHPHCMTASSSGVLTCLLSAAVRRSSSRPSRTS